MPRILPVLLCRWIALLAMLPVPALAQTLGSDTERKALEARAERLELDAASTVLSEKVRSERRQQAENLRARLSNGDFHAGDHIVLWVNGEPALSNTFTVRTGGILQLPTVGDVSLQGVLRPELKDVMTRAIARYIKAPDIQVSTQVRIAVLGAIGRPGFYSVAPDAPITDVLMTAGGPAGNADLSRSSILRGTATFADPSRLKAALAASSTLDDLGIESGDQISLAERAQRWAKIPSIISVASVLVTTTLLLSRSR
jgi:protein involved in polysaccharide export with SLBB domain